MAICSMSPVQIMTARSSISGLQFVDVCECIRFPGSLGAIGGLQVNRYGVVVRGLTRNCLLTVWRSMLLTLLINGEPRQAMGVESIYDGHFNRRSTVSGEYQATSGTTLRVMQPEKNWAQYVFFSLSVLASGFKD
jgi:hypothetical protein